jgi:hypothetical protein
MTARIEALKVPRQVSPWIVIGVAAALIAGLAVLTLDEPAVTPIRQPAVEAVRAPSESVELTGLRSAVAHRYMVEEFGIGESPSTVNERVLEAAMKARLVNGLTQPRFGTDENARFVNENALETAAKARLAQGYVETGSASQSTDTKSAHPVHRKS